MKNSKRIFFLVEAVLAIMVVILAFIMLQEKNRNDFKKISVIIPNSDDTQWSAFKYGLKMAAEDQGAEMFVVSTGNRMTADEINRAIDNEIDNGAEGIIVQPVPGVDTEGILNAMEKRVPVMFVGCTVSEEKPASLIPSTQPDNYAMGSALAEELMKDYNGDMSMKTLGILSETPGSEATISRRRGFMDRLKKTGAKVRWSVSENTEEAEENSLETQPKVNFVIALDDSSLTRAGACAAANNLHGALVYGIGHSTEAVYYLDTGAAECLVIPDEFNVGYQSLTEVAQCIRDYFYKARHSMVSHTVVRRETLFSKENQDILFTMSQ